LLEKIIISFRVWAQRSESTTRAHATKQMQPVAQEQLEGSPPQQRVRTQKKQMKIFFSFFFFFIISNM